MTLSASASYAVLGVALFFIVGSFFMAVGNGGELVGDATDDRVERTERQADTDITFVSAASTGGSQLTITVKNTGETRLSAEETDLLVNGQYIERSTRTTSVGGSTSDQVWAPGELLLVTASVTSPERATVVTEHGVEALSAVDPFALANTIVFTDRSGSGIRTLNATGVVTSFGETADVIGPAVSEFTSKDTIEVPAVDSSGNVFVVDESGTRTQLATGAKSTKSKLAAGLWQGSSPSVFFVDNGDIVRVTAAGSTTQVTSGRQADGVAGIVDFDGDGANELVYGGDDGNTNGVKYLDDDGTNVNTGESYGDNDGIGLGEPADFDADGTARTPIIDGSQNILLVDHNGNTVTLGGGNAAKSPLGTADLDLDGSPEIYFAQNNRKLKYIDDVTGSNTIKDVTDAQNNQPRGERETGVA
jgi:archaellum component FlaF (FlaF/FlaG flagellin family)